MVNLSEKHSGVAKPTCINNLRIKKKKKMKPKDEMECILYEDSEMLLYYFKIKQIQKLCCLWTWKETQLNEPNLTTIIKIVNPNSVPPYLQILEIDFNESRFEY